MQLDIHWLKDGLVVIVQSLYIHVRNYHPSSYHAVTLQHSYLTIR